MTKPATSQVAPPKGTRDLYPSEMLRQHYITRLWRDTAIRHGFEEINGPTFEMLELYTRKSGEGIVSELFRFRREGGQDDYALRPEFTPTLARMYAAKAASLPSPTKWFSIGPYFRAEKPQRGRLREFLQWNVDVLGGDNEHATADLDLLGCCIDLIVATGLRFDDVNLLIGSRKVVGAILTAVGVKPRDESRVIHLLDSRPKMAQSEFFRAANELGFDAIVFDSLREQVERLGLTSDAWDSPQWRALTNRLGDVDLRHLMAISAMLFMRGYRGNTSTWGVVNLGIFRGLAYYTGTVFEIIAEGERAIAGGGRYDNLIELFGGPPTPAVGFGMGDVVLGLLLDDKGLMPTGVDLMDALSRPGASLRPEAFVVAGSDDEDALVEPLLANLRRGIERDGFDGKPWSADRYAVRPMHARRSYKTTRNLKKLLSDAERQFARFAVILHGPDKVELRDMATRQDLTPNLVPAWGDDASRKDAASFSVDPASPIYVGGALARCLSGASG